RSFGGGGAAVAEGGGSAPAGAAAPRPLDGRPRRGKRRGRQRLGRRGRTWVGSGRRGRRNGTALAAHRAGAPCAFGRAGEKVRSAGGSGASRGGASLGAEGGMPLQTGQAEPGSSRLLRPADGLAHRLGVRGVRGGLGDRVAVRSVPGVGLLPLPRAVRRLRQVVLLHVRAGPLPRVRRRLVPGVRRHLSGPAGGGRRTAGGLSCLPGGRLPPLHADAGLSRGLTATGNPPAAPNPFA